MNPTGYNFFLGWTFVLLLFWLGSRYEGSRTIIYYVAWLAVLLLIVTHYKAINLIFTNIGLEPDTLQPSQ